MKEIVAKIAQALQQGADPQEVFGKLVEMGLPEDKAGEVMQVAMQSSQQQPAMGGMPQEAPQGMQPQMAAYGGKVMYATGGPGDPPATRYAGRISTYHDIDGADTWDEGQWGQMKDFTEDEYKQAQKDIATIQGAKGILIPEFNKRLAKDNFGEFTPGMPIVTADGRKITSGISRADAAALLKGTDYEDYYGAMERLNDLYTSYGQDVGLAGHVEQESGTGGKATAFGDQTVGMRWLSFSPELMEDKFQEPANLTPAGKFKSVFPFGEEVKVGTGRVFNPGTMSKDDAKQLLNPSGQNTWQYNAKTGLWETGQVGNLSNYYQAAVTGASASGGSAGQSYGPGSDIVATQEEKTGLTDATNVKLPSLKDIQTYNRLLEEHNAKFASNVGDREWSRAYGGRMYPDGGELPYPANTASMFTGTTEEGLNTSNRFKAGQGHGPDTMMLSKTGYNNLTPEQYAQQAGADLGKFNQGYSATMAGMLPTEGAMESTGSVMAPRFAAGGYTYPMGGGMPADNGGLTEFNGGGTHEQNPYGGIPQGPQALVESGETKFDVENYIFSDRIKVPGKKTTFADESKKIKKKYALRDNDEIDKRGMEKELSGLMELQEEVKERKAQKHMDALQELGYSPAGTNSTNTLENPIEQSQVPQAPPAGGISPEMMAQMPPQMAYGGQIQYANGGQGDPPLKQVIENLGLSSEQQKALMKLRGSTTEMSGGVPYADMSDREFMGVYSSSIGASGLPTSDSPYGLVPGYDYSDQIDLDKIPTSANRNLQKPGWQVPTKGGSFYSANTLKDWHGASGEEHYKQMRAEHPDMPIHEFDYMYNTSQRGQGPWMSSPVPVSKAYGGQMYGYGGKKGCGCKGPCMGCGGKMKYAPGGYVPPLPVPSPVNVDPFAVTDWSGTSPKGIPYKDMQGPMQISASMMNAGNFASPTVNNPTVPSGPQVNGVSSYTAPTTTFDPMAGMDFSTQEVSYLGDPNVPRGNQQQNNTARSGDMTYSVSGMDNALNFSGPTGNKGLNEQNGRQNKSMYKPWEMAAMSLPIAGNIAGALRPVEDAQAQTLDPVTLSRADFRDAKTAAKQTIAGAGKKGIQGGGDPALIAQQMADVGTKTMGQIGMQENLANTEIANREALTNLDIQKTNNAARAQAEQMDAVNQENKWNQLGAAFGQAADIAGISAQMRANLNAANKNNPDYQVAMGGKLPYQSYMDAYYKSLKKKRNG